MKNELATPEAAVEVDDRLRLSIETAHERRNVRLTPIAARRLARALNEFSGDVYQTKRYKQYRNA